MTETLLLAHAAATWALVGLIWFVQVVHYPGFAAVGEESFPAYAAGHVRRTGWVVAPLMLVEAGTAVTIVAVIGSLPAWIGLALLIGVWVSTALLQVPCHRRLERTFDGRVAARLVATNWIRTALWTARGALAAWMLA